MGFWAFPVRRLIIPNPHSIITAKTKTIAFFLRDSEKHTILCKFAESGRFATENGFVFLISGADLTMWSNDSSTCQYSTCSCTQQQMQETFSSAILIGSDYEVEPENSSFINMSRTEILSNISAIRNSLYSSFYSPSSPELNRVSSKIYNVIDGRSNFPAKFLALRGISPAITLASLALQQLADVNNYNISDFNYDDSSTAANFLSILQTTAFDGVSGRVSFDPSQDRRLDLYAWQFRGFNSSRTPELARIMRFDEANGWEAAELQNPVWNTPGELGFLFPGEFFISVDRKTSFGNSSGKTSVR